jgi:hypothetical protein
LGWWGLAPVKGRLWLCGAFTHTCNNSPGSLVQRLSQQMTHGDKSLSLAIVSCWRCVCVCVVVWCCQKKWLCDLTLTWSDHTSVTIRACVQITLPGVIVHV